MTAPRAARELQVLPYSHIGDGGSAPNGLRSRRTPSQQLTSTAHRVSSLPLLSGAGSASTSIDVKAAPAIPRRHRRSAPQCPLGTAISARRENRLGME